MGKTYFHSRNTWLNPNNGETLNNNVFMKELSKKQTVLIGETHNIAEIHRWQLHVACQIHAHNSNMMMGFEMFPRSLQSVLDEWVAGKYSTEEFLVQVKWGETWGFPAEIYLPLFHFCRQQNVRMLALNCYRELVTRVGKEGWDAIPEAERDGLTPAKPAKQEHRDYLSRYFSGAPAAKGPMGAVKIDPDRFIRAQQTWDRAFACNIANAVNEAGNNPIVIGIIGSGHLDYGYGTPYQLEDLGITNNAVLVPTMADSHDAEKIKGIADGVFRLDVVEPAAESIGKRKEQLEKMKEKSETVKNEDSK